MNKKSYKRVKTDPVPQTVHFTVEGEGNSQINKLIYHDDLCESQKIEFYGEWELQMFCDAMEDLILKLRGDRVIH